MSVRNLILELAQSMGLEGLSFAADNMTGIQFDDMALNIHADEEGGEITLFLTIGDVPAEPSVKTAAYAYLLKTNNFARNTGGGVLGVDAEERSVYFSHRFAAGSLAVTQLARIVEAFLNLAESLATELKAATKGTDGNDAFPAAPPNGIRA